ncbi:RND transporter (plasmid) [Fulvitalea axinellae]|uniref:RND transporter n=1 Tax=Fulvitalea axinellae TaxID=1182444 RepID=A0AAU9CI28_9BACT|nr:RND transporter [Fulvitalea axinellae]
MKNSFRTALLLLLCYGGQTFGQDALDGYVELGLKNNQEYIREQLRTQRSAQELKEARSFYLPDISAGSQYLISGGGRTIGFPAGDMLNPVHTALNSLSGSDIFPTDVENEKVQLLPNDFHDTRIRLIQPLLNTSIYYGYKARSAQVSMQEAKEQAFRNSLVYRIKKAYYEHASLVEQRQILSNVRPVLVEQVDLNRKLVKNGMATADAVYNAEVELHKLDAQIARVKKGVNTSRIFFNILLNRNLEETVEVDLSSAPMIANNASLDASQELALDRRAEITQVEEGIRATEYQVKKDKTYLVPELSLMADAGYQGFGYKFDSDQDYYTVAFSLTIPIFQGGRNKAKIKKSVLAKEELESELIDLRNKIRLEVAQAHYELEEAMEIHQARMAEMTSAKENFKIISMRYREDQVLPVAYNESRANLTNAELQESVARYGIKIAEANFRRAVKAQ